MFKFRFSTIILLIISIFLIGVSAKFDSATSVIYTSFINLQVREKISMLTNQVPFSLGEIFIVLVAIIILLFVINLMRRILSPSKWLGYIARVFWGMVNIVSIGLFIYIIVFGLNYHTPSLTSTLMDRYNNKYSTDVNINIDNEKKFEVLKYLGEKAIETRKLVTMSENRETGNINELYAQANEGFVSISDAFPTMKGKYSKPKMSFSSDALQFMGLDGKYSMLFNEITLSDKVPNEYLPYTLTKYMAYQRGVAKEDEAGFFAYLSCINNSDNRFKYSGYLAMTKYVLESIRENDKIAYNSYYGTLPEEIKKDINKITDYEDSYGEGAFVKDVIKKNFNRANGDFRVDKLGEQLTELVSTYYSLFTYNQ